MRLMSALAPRWLGDPPLELVGRVTHLSAFDGTEPGLVDADEVGAGGNYCINGHQFEIQADWVASRKQP